MEITAARVSELRNRTGAPLMMCKAALVETGGDLEQAAQIVRKARAIRIDTAEGSAGKQGYLAVYAHPGSQIVSIVELSCDTDFVARSEDFRAVAKELAMQVAATAPIALRPGDLSEDARDEIFRIAQEQTDSQGRTAGKTAEMREQIARDRASKRVIEQCLLTQDSIRDPKVTVGSLLDDLRLRVREGVHVRRFVRW